MNDKLRAVINAAFPFFGPCGLCGFRDGRHRIFEAMRDRYRGGDSVSTLARDYGKPRALIAAIVKARRPSDLCRRAA
jgi:hypothetical protein